MRSLLFLTLFAAGCCHVHFEGTVKEAETGKPVSAEVRMGKERAFTDPNRVRRTDPGDPSICNIFTLHGFFSDEGTRSEIDGACRSARIGCVDCKQYVIDSILDELKPIQQRVREYLTDLSGVDSIINEGREAARDVAQDTIEEVRKVMGLTGRK